ncbi:MAG TPA: hypothetical protein VGY94_02625 [Acidobacteriaceae bacterium]|jgi:uncharacterized membrane protein HdeD (DUF308 family)|nr:hypothetical protein [Acidobacteriaceae bacterium]
MTQSLIKSWWLLVLCGVFDALFAVLIVVMGSPDGRRSLHTLIHNSAAILQLGLLALAAGVCTIAASVWRSRKDNSWLLVVNGLACSSLGILITLGLTRPITFRTIALVIVIMAMSIGLYELATARTLRGHHIDEWLLGVAGVVSVGFAIVFLGFVLRWIKLDPSPSAQTFNWLGSYFGFTAICMVGLALGPNGLRIQMDHMSSRKLQTG